MCKFADGHIIITRGNESVAVDLEPFERAYRRRPDAVDAVLSTLLRVSRGEKASQTQATKPLLAKSFPNSNQLHC
jgi:hypothetical protein